MDVQELWNTSSPTLSSCFRQTALVWTPCAVPWLFLPLEVYTLKSSRAFNIPWSFLSITKLVFSFVLAGLSATKLALACRESARENDVPFYQILSPALLFATFILTIIIIHLERRHGIRTSGLLFFFWLVLFLCDSINFRSVILSYHDDKMVSEDAAGITIFFAHYPLVTGQLILSIINDKQPENVRLEDAASNACPVVNAPFVSKLFFLWLDRLILKGYRSDLKTDDVNASPPAITCPECVPPFLESWDEQLKKNSRASFQRTIFSVYWPSFIKVWILKLAGELLGYMVPVTLGWYLEFIANDGYTWHGYVLILAMFTVAVGESMFVWHASYFSTFIGSGTRVACTSMVFRKCLTLSNDARQEQVVGKIVNHVAVDVSKLHDFLIGLNFAVTMVFSMAFGLFLIHNVLGPSAFAGLLAMFLLFSLNVAIGFYLKGLEAKILKLKDQRVKLLNEAVAGIKVLKMFAWEPPFMENIGLVRKEEIKYIKKRLFFENGVVIIRSLAPVLVTIACLATYVLVNPKNILDPSKIFVTISIVSFLKLPLLCLSSLTMSFVQAYVSVKRLNSFMASEDLSDDYVQHDLIVEPVVLIENCSLAWNSSDDIILRNINLRLNPGSLMAIVGPVGSGKSSLMAAILGEMRRVEGRINTKGSMAYVPQQAWIQNATLKCNVLFGRACQPELYQRILDACSLSHDLTVLPAGDQTEIGEKGVNLSGGQKQRVSLARAVYQDCDVYLLDDPLSAVDVHVGNHIFENIVGPRGLLKDKSRILVTHSVNFLHHMNLIVFMEEGRIQEIGTYDELMARNGTSATFLTTYGQANPIQPQSSESSSINSDELMDSFETQLNPKIDAPISNNDGALVAEEHMEKGQVNKAVYLTYLRYLGVAIVTLYAIFLVLGMACFGYSQVWLSEWVEDSKSEASDPHHLSMRLGVYAGLTLAFASLVFTGLMTMVSGAVRASVVFHSRMLLSVLRSPASFFDTTPSGRIVNRFAKDIEVVDVDLIISFQDMVMASLDVLTAIVVVCISLPVFLPVVAVISVVYFIMQKLFVTTTDQLRRLESVTRSPVYSLLTEMLNGASVVRSFGRQADFIAKFEETMDLHTKHSFYNSIIFRSMGLRLDFLGNVVICAAATICIWKRDSMSSGTIALVVTYAVVINFYLAWLVHCAGLVETNIVSVERLHEYIMLAPEAPWESSSSHKPDSLWPTNGRIEFREFATRYREELTPCLRGISLNIDGCEKVGIVGRTGAGKSSVTLALLRIIEATEGSIVIDGVDIATIGLHDLRSRLTIIPQDPILFIGTLRMNLDPFDRHSDFELWQALEMSHLKDFVSTLPQGLKHEVAEGGDNLSVGQRQLICLARALLRKSKILILDEATASVDLETDDLIQATIRKEFSDCTVITIAHRLNTVMDNNRLVVMDGGEVKEFGSPVVLLNDKKSVFYDTASHSGVVRRKK